MTLRTPATILATAALAFGTAACGDDEEQGAAGGGGGGNTEQSQPAEKPMPEPVAQVDSLSGQTTSVKLDPGFVEALGSLW